MAIGKCLLCDIEIKYNPNQSSGKYCSNKHQIEYQRIQKLKNGTGSVKLLRNYLLENKIDEYFCSLCGIPPMWNGKVLTLQLDHINGDCKDNRIENVRWLCPNCHTQTENWGVLNMDENKRKNLSKGNLSRKLKEV